MSAERLVGMIYDLCDEDTWEGENGGVLARQVRNLITSQTAAAACPGCAGGFGYADNAHTRDELCQFTVTGGSTPTPDDAITDSADDRNSGEPS